jgi:hypothetical protein
VLKTNEKSILLISVFNLEKEIFDDMVMGLFRF